MTSREITGVALKVFAIYVLVQTVLAVPVLVRVYYLFNVKVTQNSEAILLWGLGGISILILLGIFVLLFKLSNKIVSENIALSSEADRIKMNEAFVLSVFGLYLTFEGVLKFGGDCVVLYVQANNPANPEMSAQTIAYVFGYLIQIIIGLTLIIKSNGWAAILRGFREAGLKSKPSNKAI